VIARADAVACRIGLTAGEGDGGDARHGTFDETRGFFV
jgi:hypothetical protein